MEIIKPCKKNIELICRVLKKGGVVIVPTDTVYGFIADATNQKGVKMIYKIKRRDRSKPLPFFVKDISAAKVLAEIDKNQEKILKKYWPGKITFILKRKKGIKLYGADKKTIALRVPRYSFLRNLLKKINKPLAQTSVNISGQPSMIKAEEIIKTFQKEPIFFVNGGDLKTKKPSKIIDLTKSEPIVLRK